MLYVTTREKFDAFTPARTLASDTAADGGRYLPYKMPGIENFEDKSFGQNVADILNLFFGCGLSAWDVEFCIGRYPVRIASMGQKIQICECWRNLDGSYEKLERHLASRIREAFGDDQKVTSWLRIAIRVAVLTAVFGELRRQGITEPVDIAVAQGDLSLAMAAWYARRWGLPIAGIVIGCGDGSDVWDLLHGGQLRTAGGYLPELERLIHGALGIDENLRFCDIADHKGVYIPTAEMRRALIDGLYTAVVSRERMLAAIPNVYSTISYILEPDAAIAYSALMDYRARTGESRYALILEDRSPAECAQQVSAALKITDDKLKELLE